MICLLWRITMSRFGFVSGDFLAVDGVLHPGGCGYYRCMLPMNVVRERARFGPPAWTADRGFGVRLDKDHAQFGFDTVVIKQLMERWMPKQMQIAKQLGQRLIVDVDDAYDFLHEANHAKQTTDPEMNKIANRNHMREVIMGADIVTVSTPFLLDYYSSMRDNVFLVRNGINPVQFNRRKHSSRRPVIGWVGGLRWRSNDMDVLRDWLPDFLEEHDLMFHHAGHDPAAGSFAEQANIPEGRMIISPMRKISEYQDMLDFDIGIVPLSNIPFNEAKSYLKGIEYAASNIPFVASDLPEYRLLSQDGIGRVADTAEQWRTQLTELLDYRTRKREAAVQREIVLRDYSINARAVEWAKVFEGSPNTGILWKTVDYRKV
jgi:glycosyltransferase involved in cell wall biosynthesis